MSNLWTINFKTLKRDFSFWILVGFWVAFCYMNIEYIFFNYIENTFWPHYKFIDEELFTYCGTFPYLSVAFSAFYIGKSYRHNTIRNRIVRGFKREKIYFLNLFTIFTVCLAFVLVYMLVIYITAQILKLDFYYGYITLLTRFALSLLPMFSICCLCTAVSINIKNEIGSLIICAMLVFMMSLVSLGIGVNDNYIEQEFYEFLYDFLPVTQLERIAESVYFELDEMYNPLPNTSVLDAAFVPYSLLTSAISTIAGLLIFKKKNIN